jgi:hypothetical protein
MTPLSGDDDTQPRRQPDQCRFRARHQLFREGWEFIIEAGTGLGVAAQFNLSLDYFFPDTIGKPLFSGR